MTHIYPCFQAIEMRIVQTLTIPGVKHKKGLQSGILKLQMQLFYVS